MNLNKIIFNNKNFDGLICLNGNLPNRDFFKNLSHIVIIAADGAADFLHKANIIPNYIVGDLDSISTNTLEFFFDKTNLFQITDQETNDFEKAVNHAISIGLKNLLIIGINGGLYEHALNNWSVFVKLSKKINLCLLDNNRYGISIFNPTEIKLRKGELLSIIPQTKLLIKTNNLKWNLDNEILEIGEREGARNIVLSEFVNLNIIEGSAFLFFDSRFPNAPEIIEL